LWDGDEGCCGMGNSDTIATSVVLLIVVTTYGGRTMTGRSRVIAWPVLSLLATVARRQPGRRALKWGAWRTAERAWPAVGVALLLLLVGGPVSVRGQQGLVLQEYPVAAGSHPHDAVADRLGRAWYSAQGDGTIGRLDPATGEYVVVRPGPGSAPH